MTDTKPRLGYIGLGLMGAPMTRRLLDAGYRVAVWNRSADKAKPLIAHGGVAVASPSYAGCERSRTPVCPATRSFG